MEQVKEGLGTRGAQISGLAIHIEAVEKVVAGARQRTFDQIKPGEDRLHALGDKQLGYPWMNVDIRIDGARRYVSYRTPQVGDPTGDSPPSTTRYAWDSKIGMSYAGSSHSGSIVTTPMNHSYQNLVFEYLDIPVSSYSYARKDRFWLPKSLDTPTTRLLPGAETLDGVPCRVVEIPALDKLWIDVNRGFALIRRERRRPDGGLQQLTEARNYVEATPGFWLPTSITRNYYLPRKAGETGDGAIATTVTIKAEYHRQSFQPSDFVFDFPPKTTVLDVRNDQTFKVPPRGVNPVDQSIEQSKFVYREPFSLGSLAAPLVVAGLLIVLLVAGLKMTGRI